MHNMIVKEKHADMNYGQGWEFEGEPVEPQIGPPVDFANFFKCIMKCEIVQLTTDSKKIRLN
jgi:hypothetical protein